MSYRSELRALWASARAKFNKAPARDKFYLLDPEELFHFPGDCKDWSKEEIDCALEEVAWEILKLEGRRARMKRVLNRLRRANARRVKQRRSLLKLID
jgi:hypothetical protein